MDRPPLSACFPLSGLVAGWPRGDCKHLFLAKTLSSTQAVKISKLALLGNDFLCFGIRGAWSVVWRVSSIKRRGWSLIPVWGLGLLSRKRRACLGTNTAASNWEVTWLCRLGDWFIRKINSYKHWCLVFCCLKTVKYRSQMSCKERKMCEFFFAKWLSYPG